MQLTRPLVAVVVVVVVVMVVVVVVVRTEMVYHKIVPQGLKL